MSIQEKGTRFNLFIFFVAFLNIIKNLKINLDLFAYLY